MSIERDGLLLWMLPARRGQGARLACAGRLAAVLLLTMLAGWASADPWPQILGPHRNGTAPGESLASQWPAEGLPVVWSAPLGMGYAGPAVAEQRVVAFHRQGDQEIVQAFGARDGKLLWTARFATHYHGGIDPDTGPRCVPVIADGTVYVLGANGDCHAVDLQSGKSRWSRQLRADYEAPEGYFGIATSPLVYQERLLVNIGGEKAGIVALDTRTGRTVWTATEDQASYSSPVLTQLAGRTAVAFVTRLNFVLLDPMTGRELMRYPFGRRGPTVNAAVPLVIGDQYFLTASYGIGAVLLEVDQGRLEPVWAADDVLSSQYNTPIHAGGLLFGIHGREDGPPADLRCADLATGRILWNRPALGVAHLMLADGKLLVLTSQGTLLMVRATGDGYDELASTTVSENITRALPALSDGHFYFRDNQGTSGRLYCLKLP